MDARSQSGDTPLHGIADSYACPVCRRPLRESDGSLRCGTCAESFPIVDGIPDFLREELAQSRDPVLRRMRFIDRMAGIYETSLWYPLVLNVYGGLHSPSLSQLIRTIATAVQPVRGRVLDVACGPGTYGRRVASQSREVFGIDVSMGMLRQGVAYSASERRPNVHFARARVEALPFASRFFEAAICCGSLHLFADTTVALREIGRVMKPAATLAVFTFGAGDGGILKHPRVRRWGAAKHGLHVFDVSEMGRFLAASGFEGFEAELSGSIFTFTARRIRS